MCRIPHPRNRSSVAASLNDDLAVISDWCSRWGMLVNPSKMRGLLISRSRTVEPLFPDLLIDGSVVEMVSELKILGVILDSKLTFEKQDRAIAASASMRAGILRKTMSDVAVVAKCFWAFILPVLEYCSPVWMPAATSHLSLLDRVVSQVSRLRGACTLWVHMLTNHLIDLKFQYCTCVITNSKTFLFVWNFRNFRYFGSY